MSLASQVNALSTRVAGEFKSVRTSLAGKAPTAHTHAVADVTGLSPAAVGLARRGGVYMSPANLLASNTGTQVDLSTISGDADLMDAGDILIPAGAGGLWSVFASWRINDSAHTRAFMDVKVNGAIYRAGVTPSEDRTSLTANLALVAGDRITFACYSTSTGSNKISEITAHAYRIGV